MKIAVPSATRNAQYTTQYTVAHTMAKGSIGWKWPALWRMLRLSRIAKFDKLGIT